MDRLPVAATIYIGGKWTTAMEDRPVHNPIDGVEIGSIASNPAADLVRFLEGSTIPTEAGGRQTLMAMSDIKTATFSLR